jgi:hypothetical protein
MNIAELALCEKSKTFFQNMQAIIYDTSSLVDIASIDGTITFDGKERPLLLSRTEFEHIFKRH